ncbi:MAG: hypothetical protein ACT4O1_07985 [Gemmatimonadota bacterium]
MSTRRFDSEDGRTWIAQIHDGSAPDSDMQSRTGWEVIQFDTTPPGSIQRITYRPSGWLANATIQELIQALQEGESVRAKWSS